ncbi:MAG TPA: PQQ-dependent sugar dehydrogenase [Saprospiraceae bacterium]|nr:hypothetical protein [Bacteroidota bacterium]HRQ31223.1 PQQ-dependent sugar dehydrogenase [Saprospiraceae bacterium]
MTRNVKYLMAFILFMLLLPGSSYSQSYTTETVINFGFNHGGTSFEFLPGNKIIVSDQDTSVRVYDLNGNFISTFWDFKDSVLLGGESGILGICLDPSFSVNHFVYIYYTSKIDTTLRIVRLTENNDVGTNPLQIFRHFRQGGIHVGGYMCFGPQYKLFVLIGNNSFQSNSQLLNNPYGKILRLNPNGSIPLDNPFYDDGNPLTGNDDRIWVYGLRNGYGMYINPFNDSLYQSENGSVNKDEINFISKGRNYGFPHCEGYCSPYNPSFKQPMMVIDETVMLPSYAPTGLVIYNGSQFPEWIGKLLVIGISPNDQFTGLIKGELGNMPFADTISSWSVILPGITGTCMKQGIDGHIYVLTYSPAALYRIIRDLSGINGNHENIGYTLSQNYPNPFNPVTSIKYEIPQNGFVTLKIFNVLGMEISTLVNQTKRQGTHEVTWSASDFPGGVYFYELNVDGFSERKKMVLIK